MKHPSIVRTVAAVLLLAGQAAVAAEAPKPAFNVLAFYSTEVEKDHVDFAEDALAFFKERAARDGFRFESTTSWDELNAARLAGVDVVVWINHFPQNEPQRRVFEQYMEHGGGWLGFHVAGYNDAETGWPWFVAFLGHAVFHSNGWPPSPALLRVDDRTHPVTRHVGASFTWPSNEWYLWKPSPRLDKDVTVLVTLDPSNYPLGTKDVLTEGDLPVVWTNTRYAMVYMNMGHGAHVLDDVVLDEMVADALVWVAREKPPRRSFQNRNERSVSGMPRLE